MATIEHPGRSYTEPPMEVPTVLRRPFFPAIRWGAIFAGVVVGLSVQLVLTLLGIASGLSSVDVTQSNTGSATGTLIWTGISMLIAAFTGGYVAARMSALKRKIDGILHGFVSWAVTTLMFAMLAASIGGTLLGGVFNSVSQGMTQNVAGTGSTAIGSLLRNQAGRMDASTLQRLQRDIESGRREDAIRVLSGTGNVTQTQAAAIVDQALIMAGSPEQASPQGRAMANRAVETAGTAAWVIFVTVALALALGILGGIMGASGARRMTWTSSGSSSERVSA